MTDEIKDFYYQIKGQSTEHDGWGWPPIFSGMVSAKTKPEAKKMVEEQFGKEFPMRVLKSKMPEQPFLLNLWPIAEDDDRTRSLFEFRPCSFCGNKFRVIDLYNDRNERYKGTEFCSYACKEKHKGDAQFDYRLEGSHQPVIYEIKNINTGKSYVGSTTQAFTLRWYQHFFQSGSCAFHRAIKGSSIEDWSFRVLERVHPVEAEALAVTIRRREQHWIDSLDTIEGGYNTATALKNTGATDLFNEAIYAK